MANLEKLKKRSALGAPPPIEEASRNLTAPEIAPASGSASYQSAGSRIDGRSLRKTNRTVQFATKVTPDYDAKFRAIAARDGLDFCVLLEKSLDAYELSR